jgi:putative transposase
MIVTKAYKTELNPNNKQIGFFRRCCGVSRFVYNWGLDHRIKLYEQGEKTSEYSQRKLFNSIKRDEYPWVTEVPYAVMESSFANLNSAYQNFFRRVKNGEKPGFPKFKCRGKNESFQLRNTKIFEDAVRLTKIGIVRLKENDYIPVNAEKYGVYSTVSERAGHWFISVLVYEEVEQIETHGTVIGVDFGIKDIAILSNGKVFRNSKPLQSAQRKLSRLQRELARRKKGGSNWRKTKRKLQRAYYKVACIRRHIQHEISSYLVYGLKPSVIVLEDLNVKGMTANHNLARAILDVGFYELRRQIEYKAEWVGIQIVIADRWYPSSKTCSRCGVVKKDLKLSDRTFICPDCGYTIDRDLNAAVNLRNLATVV